MKRFTVVLLGILAFVFVIHASGGMVIGQSEKEPIKIGLLLELTGWMAAHGYSHDKVMRAAVAKVNKDGGIAGRPVELYVEDDESKPTVGALKFRKLVESNGVDFVFDSGHSGVVIACAPIAKELRTPYFPTAAAFEISGDKGNRYVFQSPSNVKSECKGAAKFALEKLGKKWVTAVVDFAWGWSNQSEFTRLVTERGGTVLASIKVPLGTGDWLPYLKGKIPNEAEAIYFACSGSDFLSFIRDLHAVRPEIKKLGAVYSLSAQDPKKLGAAGEGVYCITSYPTRLEGLNTRFNKEYRTLINVDEDGKEIGTGIYFVLAYDWAVWEPLFAVKAAIEKSGWKGKADNPSLIKTLEGMAFKESLEFPQGDMYIRAQDHRTVTGLYVEQIQKGTLKVVTKVSAKDADYPPLVDRTKESF